MLNTSSEVFQRSHFGQHFRKKNIRNVESGGFRNENFRKTFVHSHQETTCRYAPFGNFFEPNYELDDVDLLKKLQRGTKIRIVTKLRRGFGEGSRRFQVPGLVFSETLGFN